MAFGAGHLADMGFVDPPYNVAYEGGTAAKMTIANDALGGGLVVLHKFIAPFGAGAAGSWGAVGAVGAAGCAAAH